MKLVINGADVELDGRYAKTQLPWVLMDVLGLHDPGLTRAQRRVRTAHRTSLIPSASLVI